MVVINSASDAPQNIIDRNQNSLITAQQWLAKQQNRELEFIIHNHPDLPPKHAGVGLARKIGMDAAAAAFMEAGNASGPIVCLDADCTVAPNYLQSLHIHFQQHSKTPGCSIHFEHPLAGLSPAHRQGITAYELYLRYYRQALRWAGHPAAFHTVGSSMAVRAAIYLQQGGMNRRKAGEDFYFLEKIIALGGFSEITSTTVFPSSRRSLRVPFGTGRAMDDWLNSQATTRVTYDPQIFRDLKEFFAKAPLLYTSDQMATSPVLEQFLRQTDFATSLNKIRSNTSSINSFQKKFFHFFNLFRVLKYVHWATEHHYAKISIDQAIQTLWHYLEQPGGAGENVEEWLHILRKFEAEQDNND